MNEVTITREDALLLYMVAFRERATLTKEVKYISNDTMSHVVGRHIAQLSDLLSRMEEVLYPGEQTRVS